MPAAVAPPAGLRERLYPPAVLTIPAPQSIPEQTAADLASAPSADKAHFLTVRRPDASPFLRTARAAVPRHEQLRDLLDRTIDAQPFLGQLVADPTARGLFAALALLGMGVQHRPTPI